MMSPGRLLTMPPSTRMLPCSSTGTNTPGSEALARIAFHKGAPLVNQHFTGG